MYKSKKNVLGIAKNINLRRKNQIIMKQPVIKKKQFQLDSEEGVSLFVLSGLTIYFRISFCMSIKI